MIAPWAIYVNGEGKSVTDLLQRPDEPGLNGGCGSGVLLLWCLSRTHAGKRAQHAPDVEVLSAAVDAQAQNHTKCVTMRTQATAFGTAAIWLT